MKSKQIGVTWVSQLDNLHLGLFVEGANILTLSKGQDEAAESLDYIRFAHSLLPDFLRMPMGKDQSALITFPEMESRIRALPSTEDAGVGFGGATRVVMDEFEYHKYDRKNFSEILPSILEGGQLIIQSTADQWKTNSLFKELWVAARHGDNNFYPLFFPYDVLPHRTVEWRKELSHTGLSQSDIMARYPATENEALKVLTFSLIFDPKDLEAMESYLTDPISQDIIPIHDGIVKVYKLPVVGAKYCVYSDPSDGYDPFHSVVADARTGEGIVEASGKLKADQCAKIHHELVCAYNNGYNSFEANASAGGKFEETLKALGTPNMAPRRSPDGKVIEGKIGVWASGSHFKRNMIWGLEEGVRTHSLITHFEVTMEQFKNFVRPEGEDPKVRQGMHDDALTAWEGICYLQKYIPIGGMKVTSFKYRE